MFNRGQREEPVDANGFHDRGNVYSRHGNYERAVQDYNRAIEMDGDFAEAYYDRGCSYHEVGLNEQAITDLTRAIELNPEAARYYARRSLAYVFTDHIDLAEADEEMCDTLRERGFE